LANGFDGEEVEIVSDFPSEFNKFPLISFYITNNSDTRRTHEEILSKVAFNIDVWVKGNPFSLIDKVNSIVSNMGFKRILCQEMNEESYNRTVMKFEGVVNNKTYFVYKS
jgi:hypothetical protein